MLHSKDENLFTSKTLSLNFNPYFSYLLIGFYFWEMSFSIVKSRLQKIWNFLFVFSVVEVFVVWIVRYQYLLNPKVMNTIILVCFHYLILIVLFEILHKFEIQTEYRPSRNTLKLILNKEINANLFCYFFLLL